MFVETRLCRKIKYITSAIRQELNCLGCFVGYLVMYVPKKM